MRLNDRWGLGAIALAMFACGATVFAASTPGSAEVVERLKARLPKTEVTSVECAKLVGLCEVVAGRTLFYTDRSARYLVIGRIYDMETRQDMTAARLLEINPEILLGGAAKAEGPDDEVPGRGAASHVARAGVVPVPMGAAGTRVDLSELGPSGAISWGKPSGPTVTTFTDFRCSYCRALAETLEHMNVRVIERPISVLGSRDLANRAYCARDKAAAVKAAYADGPLPEAKCDTSGLDANEAFARKHGFNGTPVIVRSDGAVLEGYRPREFLEAWLKGAK